MSNPKSKYPVVSESAFLQMVAKNEHYNGFVEHEDKIYSFVLPEVVISKEQTTEYMGKFTQYSFEPLFKYYVFKPINYNLDSIFTTKNNYNPQNQDGRNPASVIKTIFSISELSSSPFERNFKKYFRGHYDSSAKVQGLSHKPGYVSDSRTKEKADLTNQWVNDTGIFYVDNYGATSVAEFTNFLLGCMIYGVGHENLVFPIDGTVSTALKKAGIVKEALNLFYTKNKGKNDNLAAFSDEINGNKYNMPSFLKNGPLHPETFLGSAHVKVEQYSSKLLKVTIFNITSLTSGDLFKHLPNNEYPMSIIREQLSQQWNQKTQYGNMSQTYSFTFPIDYSKLK